MMKAQGITGYFGARVTDIDLASPLDDGTIDAIRSTLKKYKVLVFPDQPNLTAAGHLAFARHFGKVEVGHPTWPDYPNCPGVVIISMDGQTYGRDSWHTDGSTREDTAWISLLQAIDIPPFGRDTLFADMEAVYAGLSSTMKAFLDGLTAEHSWGRQKPDAPPVTHPVVMRDAASGRKWLYVNRTYTRRIIDLTERESTNLLEFLYEQVHIPEYQLRVSWQPRALAMWDNETTQHYIIADVAYPRVMHRVMVSPFHGAD